LLGLSRTVALVIEDTRTFRLLKLMKRTRTTIWPRLEEVGLHPGQELLLSQLWREDGLDQVELVARLGVEAPTVTKTLQRLERAGFVKREPANGRRRRVFLTAGGRAAQRPVEEAWAAADGDLSRALSTEEQELLDRLLSKMATSELAG
jgi:DNA-binding MarR family transcriptional regulator